MFVERYNVHSRTAIYMSGTQALYPMLKLRLLPILKLSKFRVKFEVDTRWLDISIKMRTKSKREKCMYAASQFNLVRNENEREGGGGTLIHVKINVKNNNKCTNNS